MPELPEVETIRRDLEAGLLGKTISAINILSPKTARNKAAFFKKKLLSARFQEISRRGKLLIFKFGADDFLLIHLKMTGQLIYLGGGKKVAGGHSLESKKASVKNSFKNNDANFLSSVGGELPNKYTRLSFSFKDGSCLFFNDLRRFGYLKIVDKKELNDLLVKNYGPEPLEKTLNQKYLQDVLKGKKKKIKALLLDQHFIAGLGNIYVDESLFAAGIRPDRLAGSLKPKEITALLKAIRDIIKKAIKYRGTTFSDYRDSQGQKGNFSRFLQVYGRQKENCKKCGRPLIKAKIAGRGTHYCQNCQK